MAANQRIRGLLSVLCCAVAALISGNAAAALVLVCDQQDLNFSNNGAPRCSDWKYVELDTLTAGADAFIQMLTTPISMTARTQLAASILFFLSACYIMRIVGKQIYNENTGD